MESNNKKFSDFIGDLKASNIASNISSLSFYSDQIYFLLELINPQENFIVEKNITLSKESIKNISKIDFIDFNEIIYNFIRFGESFQIIVYELKRTSDIKYLKKIAIHYLDIAKLTKDERVKKIAFDIADSLSV